MTGLYCLRSYENRKLWVNAEDETLTWQTITGKKYVYTWTDIDCARKGVNLIRGEYVAVYDYGGHQ